MRESASTPIYCVHGVRLGAKERGVQVSRAEPCGSRTQYMKKIKTDKEPIAPKFPRLVVSKERHVALQLEAKRKKITLAQLAEEKFNLAK